MQKTPKGTGFYTNGFLGKMFSSQTVMRREKKKKRRQRPRESTYCLSLPPLLLPLPSL